MLSLTAQAFLLTIALGAGHAPWVRIISAFFSALAAAASVQLMARHRYYELADAFWLQNYEENRMKCRPVHGSERPFGRNAEGKMWSPVRRISQWPAHLIWFGTLAVFGSVGVVAMFLAVFYPSVFDPGNP